RFKLTGPNNYVAFSNQSTSSGLITLPTAGSYVLEASTLGTGPDNYTFKLQETSQTALTLGTTFNGTLAGSGHVQLFKVDVPQAQQFLVTIQAASSADHTELYVNSGSPPTRSDYQYVSAAPGSSQQHVLVPMAAPGTWYILVYAVSVPAPPSSYSLTAAVSPV